jgi:hypothetical protein
MSLIVQNTDLESNCLWIAVCMVPRAGMGDMRGGMCLLLGIEPKFQVMWHIAKPSYWLGYPGYWFPQCVIINMKTIKHSNIMISSHLQIVSELKFAHSLEHSILLQLAYIIGCQLWSSFCIQRCDSFCAHD